MSLVINTNILALTAQRNLGTSGTTLARALQRLSSGLRINSARDDPSGLAIAERLTSQIRGQSKAIRNANDGISIAQIAEGSLGTMTDSLQRIRELAVQAANDTNSASDREALNQEARQLLAEVSRIAESSEFAGRKLLDGSVENLYFQIGPNQGQSLILQGADARSTTLGRSVARGEQGLTAGQRALGIASISTLTMTLNPDAANAFSVAVDFTGVTSLEQAVSRINAELDRAALTEPTVRAAAPRAAIVTDDAGVATVVINAQLGTPFRVDGGAIAVNDGTGAPAATLFSNTAAERQDLGSISINSRKGAIEALAVLEGAIDRVSSLRARFGAVQGRFESVINNLAISRENAEAARSRIRDADYAAETAALVRAQILQQAGVAMLAIAIRQPQIVLDLLRSVPTASR
jgi:flagellin